MGKSFRTVDELIKILESRGVRTDENTPRAIERESYYAIVNGYKGPFLDREAMQHSSDDVFRQGTEFQWLYDLFLFDRDLRSVTFKYLTRAEAIMRTSVAYTFCKNHPEKDAYLERSNFCDAKSYLVPKSFKGNKASLHSKNLSDLMTRLNKKLVPRKNSRAFIKHYVKAYGTVPLWVLVNDLTFGNIGHFYQLMQPKDRREVCKNIAAVSERDGRRGHLTERELLRASSVLNDFRNLCAHDERLYCARFDNDGFSDMTVLMTTFLPEMEVLEFVGEITMLFDAYDNRLYGVSPIDLLSEMGFRISRDDGVKPKSIRRGALPPMPGARESGQRAARRKSEQMRERGRNAWKKKAR